MNSIADIIPYFRPEQQRALTQAIEPASSNERFLFGAVDPFSSSQVMARVGLVALAILFTLATVGLGLILVHKLHRVYSDYQQKIAQKARAIFGNTPLPAPIKPAKPVVKLTLSNLETFDLPLSLIQREELLALIKSQVLPRPKLGPAGNKIGCPNIGNSCYMNASLQLLAASTVFDPMLASELSLPDLEAPIDYESDDAELQGQKKQFTELPLGERKTFRETFEREQNRLIALKEPLLKQLTALIHKIRMGQQISSKEAKTFYFLTLANGWNPGGHYEQADQQEFLNWLLSFLPRAPSIPVARETRKKEADGPWSDWTRGPAEKSYTLPIEIPVGAILNRGKEVAGLPLLVEATLVEELVPSTIKRRDAVTGVETEVSETKKTRPILTGFPPKALVLYLKRTLFERGDLSRFDGRLALFDPKTGQPVTLELPFEHTKGHYQIRAISLHTEGPKHYRALVRKDPTVVEPLALEDEGNEDNDVDMSAPPTVKPTTKRATEIKETGPNPTYWQVMDDSSIRKPSACKPNIDGYVLVCELKAVS